MTDFRIESLPFDKDVIGVWALERPENSNWPVVYTINGNGDIYVGETTNASMRFTNHLSTPNKQHLTEARVIFREDFNKSACLDLESHLIRYFAADGKYRVLNGNGGISDSDYFERDRYRESFQSIFDHLVKGGLLTRTIPEIDNSDLFKYSPFKALTSDQTVAIEGILENLIEQFESGISTGTVIQGDPGTGKTIVAIYLIKLLRDIGAYEDESPYDPDTIFSEFFLPGYREIFRGIKIGLVIPQISLRRTLEKVFSRTVGLSPEMILDPFQVGESEHEFDLLIVDEAHRLQQRANQPAAERNIKFAQINMDLFGNDDKSKTQLDWIIRKSKFQIFLLDAEQSVKPADLQAKHIEPLVEKARLRNSLFKLHSQMRVSGGTDYIEFVGRLLRGADVGPALNFGDYDLKFFENFADMKKAIEEKNAEVGLSRILAGFAWPWRSKSEGIDYDIEIEGIRMPWNRRNFDWVNSPTSSEEVGSIHTIQGYDLNYAGVIIGRDLYFDPELQEIRFSRENYFDKKGKENNPTLGIKYTDADLLKYVTSIYRVLLTRGIKGTYIYVHDENLRDYFRTRLSVPQPSDP